MNLLCAPEAKRGYRDTVALQKGCRHIKFIIERNHFHTRVKIVFNVFYEAESRAELYNLKLNFMQKLAYYQYFLHVIGEFASKSM